ncbi:class I SAM-dependent methyltransferase [Variovorax sp. dw_954]|uniref:class I SAM-dependent methyltransferase n=1 Tax=Variovorax sp. dw_954 TaxID=2720078 RepID=UPI001BD390E8|nr:class I SAM-dependent methyltransferase [Variovorax sp. dw_954]
MTGFSADWLALREPFDLAARAGSGHALALRALAARLRGKSALRVIDLACGTGANVRALAPQLGGAQQWLLVDHDPALLAAMPQHFAAWAQAQGFAWRTMAEGWRIEGPDWQADIMPRRVDLATGLATLPFHAARLVTTSALLDLVSADWLDALLGHVTAARPALLFALTVDGLVAWNEVDADDAAVQALFRAHQLGDKGFGPALGVDAVPHVAARLGRSGYRVTQARSDWVIEPPHHAMLQAMVQGMAAAALEQDASARALVHAWSARRLAAIGRTSLRVGHVDVLAVPADDVAARKSRSHNTSPPIR